MGKKLSCVIVAWVFGCCCLFYPRLSRCGDGFWQRLDRGLAVGRFDRRPGKPDDPEMVIIRVNPEYYELVLLCASQLKEKNMTVKQWCLKYKLIGGVNAGMFQEDYKSNVGYMKNFVHVNNPRISPLYKSVAAFHPRTGNRPLFRIFDADRDNIRDVIDRYATVVQNLRLIRRTAENRWDRKQGKKWCEVALGEDKKGNALFIFSRKPYSMYEFNEILLKLPLDLVAAQHLEGGPLASLYFSYAGVTFDFIGSCAINIGAGDGNSYWAVPNVIGFRKRREGK